MKSYNWNTLVYTDMYTGTAGWTDADDIHTQQHTAMVWL